MMRILFDQSSHDMRNKGNNALLETAMHRLGKFWPNSSLEVITTAPNLLRFYYPYAIPVYPFDLQCSQSRFDQYKRLLPRALWWLMFELREEIWHRRYLKEDQNEEHLPSAAAQSETRTQNHTEYLGLQPMDKSKLLTAISRFDLLVATGGGYMTDTDKPMLWNVFDRLEAAITNGIPTIMVGQGIGTLKDPQLLARARDILSSVELILYRNRHTGLPILESLGVSPERIIMTGDDAIEMAYKARADHLGRGIGVSLRVAHYTQVAPGHLDIVRGVLHQAASRHQAKMIAVPISSARHESDSTHIKQILKGYKSVSQDWRKLGLPMDAILQASKCRVMVTGTYHGAIFSLAQGIPVVGVARSAEYVNKLSELSDEFPAGIRMVNLNDDRLKFNLNKAIEDSWSSAEETRDSLLKDAARLIDLQHRAYEKVYETIRSKIKQ
jgi:colanic acid/amylovoran biosynthesis protein